MNGARNRSWPRWWRRVQISARRANFYAVLTAACLAAFTVMSVVTWLTISTQANRNKLLPSDLTAGLLVGTLVPALGLLILLGRHLALRRVDQTSGARGGQMHVQLVFLFSIVSAVPTLLVVLFASLLSQSGVEFWFSDSSRGLLENANRLARGYYEQTQRDMEYESLAMAGDMRDFLSAEPLTSPRFQEFYAFQVTNRNLSESTILQKAADGTLRKAAIARGESPLTEEVSTDVVRKLDRGEAIVVNASANRIQAVTPVDRRAGIYLYTARTSDLLSGQSAENIVKVYDVLTKRARILQLRYNVALFVASLVIVGLAVWFALRFADRQVKPLHQLVGAAREVGSGNFSLRVEGRTGADEIGLLNRAFNRMTAQLELQTSDLVGANQQLDERRAFIEAVLESITAGIISTSTDGRVQLINSTAQKLLLDRDAPPPIGVALATVAPQFAAMLEAGRDNGIIQYPRGSELLTLAVKQIRSATGHVITFEDITRQLLDQRQAAWSDVARRIAHEIKNPLTPIQLATERLSRRYSKQITTDPDLFAELTSTIIRQVGELRKMVDEFSSFARIPKPVFRGEDPVDLARQALFLQEVARADINFDFKGDPRAGTIACDRHQFGQAMTNVLKNAIEAIEAKQKLSGADYRGQVLVELRANADFVMVSVTDNGIGLPQDGERIVEPYVTTREKGTGLGLAIVKKIVEEHGGDMAFGTAKPEGAIVTLKFSRDPLSGQRPAQAAE